MASQIVVLLSLVLYCGLDQLCQIPHTFLEVSNTSIITLSLTLLLLILLVFIFLSPSILVSLFLLLVHVEQYLGRRIRQQLLFKVFDRLCRNISQAHSAEALAIVKHFGNFVFDLRMALFVFQAREVIHDLVAVKRQLLDRFNLLEMLDFLEVVMNFRENRNKKVQHDNAVNHGGQAEKNPSPEVIPIDVELTKSEQV